MSQLLFKEASLHFITNYQFDSNLINYPFTLTDVSVRFENGESFGVW